MAEAAGVVFLSAPIFGRPDAIALHKGLCISAGPVDGRQRVSRVFLTAASSASSGSSPAGTPCVLCSFAARMLKVLAVRSVRVSVVGSPKWSYC